MIHQYKNNGYDIIMDVNSGAVHVVEDVVYDAVACLSERLEDLEFKIILGHVGSWRIYETRL